MNEAVNHYYYYLTSQLSITSLIKWGKRKESMSNLLCLFFVCIIVTLVSANFCGGNCPSGDCPSCPCGTTVNKIDIVAWCAKHTWNRSHCECIMNAESKGNANSVNYNSDGTYDVGLWQINKYNWNACSGGAVPCSTANNLLCAIDVYNWGGQTWKFWSTCSQCGACNSA